MPNREPERLMTEGGCTRRIAVTIDPFPLSTGSAAPPPPRSRLFDAGIAPAMQSSSNWLQQKQTRRSPPPTQPPNHKHPDQFVPGRRRSPCTVPLARLRLQYHLVCSLYARPRGPVGARGGDSLGFCPFGTGSTNYYCQEKSVLSTN
eukprot:985768-Rhodomonas_salina.2